MTQDQATTPFVHCPSTTFLPAATHCANARWNRCQDLNSFSLEELKQTTLVLRGWDYPVSIRIWNPITTTWMKQLTWLRFVHFGDWCLRLALHATSSVCQKWMNEIFWDNFKWQRRANWHYRCRLFTSTGLGILVNNFHPYTVKFSPLYSNINYNGSIWHSLLISTITWKQSIQEAVINNTKQIYNPSILCQPMSIFSLCYIPRLKMKKSQPS